MKKQYYYVISALPTLFLNKELPIRKRDFLSICKENLRTADFEMISSIDFFKVEPVTSSLDIIRSFFRWESGLRNELIRLRADSLGLKSEEFLRNEIYDHSRMLIAEEAFLADSPLMAEDILNKARWNYLDKLEFSHYFDIEILAIFFIKLQILERISLFDEVKGLEKLNAVVAQGVQDTD